DPETGRYVLAIAALLHRRYFRSEVFGIENFPAGRALVVANFWLCATAGAQPSVRHELPQVAII
ncbi:MAG: hypothetical protein AAF141_13190, partial [Pseudomonadota bacterium]